MAFQELSDSMLLFYYITNKKQIATLSIAQKELEEEMKKRANAMLEKYGRKKNEEINQMVKEEG